MSIKPIDFQVILPKTQEVAKAHSDTQNKSSSLSVEQANAALQDAKQKVNHVHSQSKAENVNIKEKQEKSKQDKKNNKNKKGNYSKDKKQIDDGSTFDVMV